jgi:hypothetical protein
MDVDREDVALEAVEGDAADALGPEAGQCAELGQQLRVWQRAESNQVAIVLLLDVPDEVEQAGCAALDEPERSDDDRDAPRAPRRRPHQGPPASSRRAAKASSMATCERVM